MNISDFTNELINSITNLQELLEDNKYKIIKRKIRVKNKVKYQYLIRHNVLLDNFPLLFPAFALKNVSRTLKKYNNKEE